MTMTQEEAAELLEVFRSDGRDPPPLSGCKLAHAYIAVLGSLRAKENGASRIDLLRLAVWSGMLALVPLSWAGIIWGISALL